MSTKQYRDKLRKKFNSLPKEEQRKKLRAFEKALRISKAAEQNVPVEQKTVALKKHETAQPQSHETAQSQSLYDPAAQAYPQAVPMSYQQQPAYQQPVLQPIAPTQVNTSVVVNSGSSNSLGITSLIIGLIALFLCWLPFIGLGFAILGGLLAITGLVMATARKGRGVGYAIGGGAVSALALLIGGFVTLFAFNMGSALNELAEKAEAKHQADVKTEAEAKWFGIGEEILINGTGVTLTRIEEGKLTYSYGSGDQTITTKDKYYTCYLTVRNTKENKRLSFSSGSWLSSYGTDDILNDEFENGYSPHRPYSRKAGESYKEINPGGSVETGLVFDVPVKNAKTFRLKLAAIDGEGDYRFEFNR